MFSGLWSTRPENVANVDVEVLPRGLLTACNNHQGAATDQLARKLRKCREDHPTNILCNPSVNVVRHALIPRSIEVMHHCVATLLQRGQRSVASELMDMSVEPSGIH